MTMMNNPCWPEWLDNVWAKSAGKGLDSRPESLAAHTWRVLQRLSEFISLRPRLPARLGVPRLWHLLTWAAFLHDWGKAAAGFQAQLRGRGRWEHRHEVLSLVFVDWVAAGLSDEEQDWVAAAIVTHHKDADEIRRLYPYPDVGGNREGGNREEGNREGCPYRASSDVGAGLAPALALRHRRGDRKGGNREGCPYRASSGVGAGLAPALASRHRRGNRKGGDRKESPLPDDDQVVEMVAEVDAGVLNGLYRWLDECAGVWLSELELDRVGVESPSLPDRERAISQVQEQGAVSIYRWLKRGSRFVRRLERSDDQKTIIGTLTLRGYLINADHSASAYAGPLPYATFEAGSILHSRGLRADDLFAHQVQAGQVVGSALLTAPTGSGKTEAALLWAANQVQDGSGLPRLFYTLPYQASMNAMKLRLEQSFPGLVGLQHGRSLLTLYRMLMERGYGPEQAARKAKWARNLMQLNYPPVRVISPYQILKGMYRLKGYEALLSDCHDAAFVLDEIHAYEVKRLAMILKMVEYLRRNYGARFLVMSATFPTLIKRWLREALDGPVEITASARLFESFRRHRLVLLDGELCSEEGLARIVNDALAGRSVLVTCNLVARAQMVYRALVERLSRSGIQVVLLHGRFNGRDRLRKEKLVRESVGTRMAGAGADTTSDGVGATPAVAHNGGATLAVAPNGGATPAVAQGKGEPCPYDPIGGMVLVATQVVEVSLDIDLDTIYTDPAPLEALVQRFGRVNRRGRQRGLAPVYVYRLPNDGQHVYDQELVARTLRVLEREDGHPVDESAVGKWLDEVYDGELADRWQEEYLAAAREFEETCLRSLHAFASDEWLTDLFYRAFDGLEVLPEGLYDEYRRLREEEPIRAAELLVPISWGRYHALANDGRVWPREPGEPYIVRASYDSELGLTFEEAEARDDDWL